MHSHEEIHSPAATLDDLLKLQNYSNLPYKDIIFGKFTLNKEGIKLKDKTVAWDEIESVNYNGSGLIKDYYCATIIKYSQNIRESNITINPKQNSDYQNFIKQIICCTSKATIDPDFSSFLKFKFGDIKLRQKNIYIFLAMFITLLIVIGLFFIYIP